MRFHQKRYLLASLNFTACLPITNFKQSTFFALGVKQCRSLLWHVFFLYRYELFYTTITSRRQIKCYCKISQKRFYYADACNYLLFGLYCFCLQHVLMGLMARTVTTPVETALTIRRAILSMVNV